MQLLDVCVMLGTVLLFIVEGCRCSWTSIETVQYLSHIELAMRLQKQVHVEPSSAVQAAHVGKKEHPTGAARYDYVIVLYDPLGDPAVPDGNELMRFCVKIESHVKAFGLVLTEGLLTAWPVADRNHGSRTSTGPPGKPFRALSFRMPFEIFVFVDATLFVFKLQLEPEPSPPASPEDPLPARLKMLNFLNFSLEGRRGGAMPALSLPFGGSIYRVSSRYLVLVYDTNVHLLDCFKTTHRSLFNGAYCKAKAQPMASVPGHLDRHLKLGLVRVVPVTHVLYLLLYVHEASGRLLVKPVRLRLGQPGISKAFLDTSASYMPLRGVRVRDGAKATKVLSHITPPMPDSSSNSIRYFFLVFLDPFPASTQNTFHHMFVQKFELRHADDKTIDDMLYMTNNVLHAGGQEPGDLDLWLSGQDDTVGCPTLMVRHGNLGDPNSCFFYLAERDVLLIFKPLPQFCQFCFLVDFGKAVTTPNKSIFLALPRPQDTTKMHAELKALRPCSFENPPCLFFSHLSGRFLMLDEDNQYMVVFQSAFSAWLSSLNFALDPSLAIDPTSSVSINFYESIISYYSSKQQ